ncbi:transcriptional regulator GcvA [Saccharospirillum mangrovi]|uniref:transcriptional regulator GcvA n=1 Tax=Saccharospirillum mangrovi TaxID=2161747 RepID=UPI000D3B4B91|nr:transcriptional regulator GcvA [Saccharospirillum mangrovi]
MNKIHPWSPPIQRLPPLNSLRSFEAAARLGSFQRAARELFVTPSAVSHQIKSLEAFLEVELFIRQTRRIELTSAGKDYLHTIQGALNEIEKATAKLTATHNSGELRLAVAPAFLSRWVLPRISRFYDQYPNIELDIAASVDRLDFAHSATDMAVYYGDGHWDDVAKLHLKDVALVPVCSPDLLAAHPIRQPADLAQFTLLHVMERPDEWPAWFSATGAEFRETRKAQHFSSGLLTAQAAARGLGVALTDLSLVSEELQSGQLVIAWPTQLELGKALYLVYQKDRPMSFAMRQFRDWIMAEMAADAALPPAETDAD